MTYDENEFSKLIEEFQKYIPEKKESYTKSETKNEDEQPPKVCDEILAEYLNNEAKVFNPIFYGKVMLFILMYRDFFGTQAEEIFLSDRPEDNNNKIVEEKYEEEKAEKEDEKNLEKALTSANKYCQNHDTDKIPEVSNEFILDYYDKNPSQEITRNEIIELTQRFCEWLFLHSYTGSKLSLLEEYNA